MSDQIERPASGRPLNDEYEQIRRDGSASGQDDDEAKRGAAEAVHEERREERIPDKERAPR